MKIHSILLPAALAAIAAGCLKNAGDAVHTLAEEPLPVVAMAAENGVFERAATVQGSLDKTRYPSAAPCHRFRPYFARPPAPVQAKTCKDSQALFRATKKRGR